jgi:sensor domain CHASE-containing protein
MPENMNIRVDLLLLWPLLFLTGLLYIVKIVILLSKKEDIEDNQILQQTATNE